MVFFFPCIKLSVYKLVSTGGQCLCPDGLVKKRPGTNGMRSLSGARKQKPRKGSLAVGGAVIKADTGDRGGFKTKIPAALHGDSLFFFRGDRQRTQT